MYPQSQKLSYAPTPYPYTSSISARINLDEEVKLSTTSAERDLHESLAEIYSILITLDALEKAYLKDSVPDREYTDICGRLLNQYKSNLVDPTVSRVFRDLESFKREWIVSFERALFRRQTVKEDLTNNNFYQIECPRATERIRVGLPSTVTASQPAAQSSTPSHTNGGTGGTGSAAAASLVVTASENFITFLDAIKLGYVSKDTLHPLLVDIIQAVNNVTKEEFQSKEKIVQWLITLNQMKATQELNDEQTREITFDIESAYNGFKATLG